MWHAKRNYGFFLITANERHIHGRKLYACRWWTTTPQGWPQPIFLANIAISIIAWWFLHSLAQNINWPIEVACVKVSWILFHQKVLRKLNVGKWSVGHFGRKLTRKMHVSTIKSKNKIGLVHFDVMIAIFMSTTTHNIHSEENGGNNWENVSRSQYDLYNSNICDVICNNEHNKKNWRTTIQQCQCDGLQFRTNGIVMYGYNKWYL